MKKRTLSLLSLLMASVMLWGSLTSCTPGEEESSSTESSTTSSETDGATTESGTTGTESDAESTETDTEKTEEVTDEDTVVFAEGLFGPTIAVSNDLKNKVQTYFLDENRTNYVVNNKYVTIEASLGKNKDEFFGVNALKNTKTAVFILRILWTFSFAPPKVIRIMPPTQEQKLTPTFTASDTTTTMLISLGRIL